MIHFYIPHEYRLFLISQFLRNLKRYVRNRVEVLEEMYPGARPNQIPRKCFLLTAKGEPAKRKTNSLPGDYTPERESDTTSRWFVFQALNAALKSEQIECVQYNADPDCSSMVSASIMDVAAAGTSRQVGRNSVGLLCSSDENSFSFEEEEDDLVDMSGSMQHHCRLNEMASPKLASPRQL